MNGGLMKAAGHGAVAALAGLLLNSGSALAADLGGNCCADLEERVAELEATTVRKGNRRVSLTLSGQVNRSLMYWDDGFQQDLYSVDNAISNSRFRLLGSGKINADLTAGFYLEFGLALGARSHQVSQIDDDGIAGFGGILGGLPFGDGIGGAGDSIVDFNQAYWYIDSKHWGRLSLGRLSTTTAGITIIDLSNTGVIANSMPFLWGGGMIMRNGIGRLATTTWGQQCGGPSPGPLSPIVLAGVGGAGPYGTDCGIHALSRRDAVMYTTPTWHGFTFGASFGEDNFSDASARYAGELHGFRLAAGVGYRWYGDREPDIPVPLTPLAPTGPLADTDRRHVLVSGSLMHVATGLFVSGAWTQYEYHGSNIQEVVNNNPNVNRPDTVLWWVDAGIQKNWTGWGGTTFYGEYGRVYDGVTGLTAGVPGPLGQGNTSGYGLLGATGVILDSEMWWWGLGTVQTIDAAAMDLYIGYRRYSADVTTSGLQITGGLEDIWYLQAGARIQF